VKTFKDNQGRVWSVQINVTTLRRVLDLLKVNLLKLTEGGVEGLGEFLSNIILLVDTLYCLCKDEADARGVTDEEFGRSMWGDAIQGGMDAFLEEYADFFPDAKKREILKQWLAKGRRVEAILSERGLKEMEKLGDVEVADRVMAEVAAGRLPLSNGKSGSTPASSASTPAPSPSDSSN
jgi:hypothetical protein